MPTATQEPPIATPVGEGSPAKEPEQPPGFQMPETKRGRIVIWRAGGAPANDPGILMIVTKVGQNAISGSLIGEGRNYLGPANGVRHIEDPEARFFQDGGGTWEDTDDTKELKRLKKIVNDLHEYVFDNK